MVESCLMFAKLVLEMVILESAAFAVEVALVLINGLPFSVT